MIEGQRMKKEKKSTNWLVVVLLIIAISSMLIIAFILIKGSKEPEQKFYVPTRQQTDSFCQSRDYEGGTIDTSDCYGVKCFRFWGESVEVSCFNFKT